MTKIYNGRILPVHTYTIRVVAEDCDYDFSVIGKESCLVTVSCCRDELHEAVLTKVRDTISFYGVDFNTLVIVSIN